MNVGIVCEYNPMHNAHVYHINKSRESEDDFIVCVMSGNFVQRGQCASVDKFSRAEIAVRNGADVVLELPTPWAIASAEDFARGAVSILNAFGIDKLSFGSEVEDPNKLIKCALAQQDEKLMQKVYALMKTGLSYPMALTKTFEELNCQDYSDIISNPNSTLAIEYIKQIHKINPEIEILPIKREAVEHDSELTEGQYASASMLRNLKLGSEIEKFVPKSSFEIIKNQIENGYAPCEMQNIERAFLNKLRLMSKEELSRYISDDRGLVSRVYDSARASISLDEFYDNIKTKNYTHSRIRRETLAVFLGIDKNISCSSPSYIKVLAVNQRGLKLIAKQKDQMKLPLVTKYSEAMKLDEKSKYLYNKECQNTDVFALCSKKIRPCSLEQTRSMIIIKD